MIYFILERRNCQFGNDRVKIGFTAGNTVEDAEKRCKQLQTGNSNDLVFLTGVHDDNTIGLTELTAHKLLREHHVRGEWFVYGEGVKEFIAWIEENNRVPLEKAPKPEKAEENGDWKGVEPPKWVGNDKGIVVEDELPEWLQDDESKPDR